MKIKQELEKQLENYLIKTSNHVFLIEGGFYYKVLPLHSEGNLYYITLIMGKDNVTMNVKQAIPERDYQYYGNDSANVVKSRLFPEYYKTKSIPNFKRIRKLIDEITPKIKFDNKSNEELVGNIRGRLIELESVK